MSIDRVWLLMYDGSGRPMVWDVFKNDVDAFEAAKRLNKESVVKEPYAQPYYVESHRVRHE